MGKQTTSWSKSAEWYDKLLSEEGTYQKDLILPNLLRLMEIKKGEIILDLACGQGFFSREFYKKGARVIGADISKKLIDIARNKSPKEIRFEPAPADNLKFLPNKSANKIIVVLAIQNIDKVSGVFSECRRVLKSEGKLFIVMNHPAFRVLKKSSWEYDEKNKVQYRRIDEYVSESKEKILMHPSTRVSTEFSRMSSGQVPGESDESTISFHRPLQFYFKALNKSGFCVSRLEEWNSNKKSQPGPHAAAENKARKEIPLFLFIEAV